MKILSTSIFARTEVYRVHRVKEHITICTDKRGRQLKSGLISLQLRSIHVANSALRWCHCLQASDKGSSRKRCNHRGTGGAGEKIYEKILKPKIWRSLDCIFHFGNMPLVPFYTIFWINLRLGLTSWIGTPFHSTETYLVRPNNKLIVLRCLFFNM